MPTRPSLLFVAPILPAQSGNGLAMRAGVFLDALAGDFRITLLVIPVAGGYDGPSPRFVTERTARVVTLSLADKIDPLWDLCSRVIDPGERATALARYPRPALCRYATTPCLNEARAALAGERFDAVHVMRSYLAPYAAPFLAGDSEQSSPVASLDLDDDEASTHSGLAALLEQSGRLDDARVELSEAAKYERLETEWLPRFRRLITCTAVHAQAIANAHPECRVAAIPNTVVLPPHLARRLTRGGRILFVGNLSYLPNVDGIRRFAVESLPQLRASRGANVVLRIAGSAPAPNIAALAALPGVELVANPEDLAEHYAWADLAVVPVHAGGGTRIKLLEAFAHDVPVVSTCAGAKGIDAEDRVHLLLADSSDALAQACAELMFDASLAARLAASARQLVEARYAHGIGIRLIQKLFGKARSG